MLKNFFYCFLFLFVISSCVQSNQEFFINQNGEGKVNIDATMVLSPKMAGPGQNQTENTYKDKVKMVKKVREIINKSEGVEAWNNIEYKLDDEGKLNFSATAYFPAIENFKLTEEIPAIPVPEFNEDAIRWAFKMDKNSGVEAIKKTEPVADEEVDEIVNQIQQEYKQASMMMSMVMNLFQLEAEYHFPYKIKSVKNLEKTGDRSISFQFNGENLMEGFENLMENETRLAKLVKNQGIRKFDFEDPRIIKAAYPDEEIMKATFKTGWFSPKPVDPFNYEDEVAPLRDQSLEIPLPEKPEPPKPEIFTGMPNHHELIWNNYNTTHGVAINKGKFALANSSRPSTVDIYDCQKKSVIQSIEVKKKGLSSPLLEWNPGNPELLMLGYSNFQTNKGVLKILDIKNGQVVCQAKMEGNPMEITWIDQNNIAMVNEQGYLQTGHLTENSLQLGEQNNSLVKKEDNLNAVQFDGFTEENEGKLVTYDISSGQVKLFKQNSNNELKFEKNTIEVPNKEIPGDLLIAPNNNYMALHLQSMMYIYKRNSLYDSMKVAQTTSNISWNPDGTKLVYLNPENQLVFYNAETKRKIPFASEKKFENHSLIDETGNYLLLGRSGTPGFQLLKLGYQ